MGDWKSDREDEFFYLKIALGVLVVVAAVAGLIEWNARRQAAAMTRELTRPMTVEESEALNRELLEAMEPTEAEIAAARDQLWGPPVIRENNARSSRQRIRNQAPLQEGERCIEGQRFRKLANGWEEIGTC